MNKKTIAIILSIFTLNKGNVYGLVSNDNLKWKNNLTSKALPVSLALGGALAGGYFVRKKITNNNSGNLKSDNSKYGKFSYESKSLVNKIEIDEMFSDMNVSVGDVQNVVVEYYQNEKRKYEISEENGTLKIKELVKLRISFFDNTDPSVPGPLKVTVPKNKIDFDISGFFGDMSLENLKSSHIKVDCSHGDIRLKSTTADKIDLNSSFGDINFENLKSSHIKVDCSHGNIRLKSTTADKIDLNSSFGDINFENLNAKNIKIEGSHGDVSGSLVGSERDYVINSHTNFGSCNLKNSSSGSRTLNLNSFFGDIDIDFDK